MNQSLAKARIHWVYGRRRRSCKQLARALRRPGRLTPEELAAVAALCDSICTPDAQELASRARAELAWREWAAASVVANGSLKVLLGGSGSGLGAAAG